MIYKKHQQRDFLACGAALLEWSVISFGCLQKSEQVWRNDSLDSILATEAFIVFQT